MKNQFRAPFLWLLIAVGYVLHSLYGLTGLYFGIELKIAGATGKVPLWFHLFRIVIELSTFTFCLLTLYLHNKNFVWISLVWGIILLLLNIVHLGETAVKEYRDLSQLALLSFILAVNILLVSDLRKQLNQYPNQVA